MNTASRSTTLHWDKILVLIYLIFFFWSSLVAQMVKNLPVMQATWVQSLGRKGPLEEGNGNPLQYSCLENPTDRGAWRATVYGVTKSQTPLSN